MTQHSGDALPDSKSGKSPSFHPAESQTSQSSSVPREAQQPLPDCFLRAVNRLFCSAFHVSGHHPRSPKSYHRLRSTFYRGPPRDNALDVTRLEWLQLLGF